MQFNALLHTGIGGLPADNPGGTKEVSSLSARPFGNSTQGSWLLLGPTEPSAGSRSTALRMEDAQVQLWFLVSSFGVSVQKGRELVFTFGYSFFVLRKAYM